MDWFNSMDEKGIPLGQFLYESPSRHLIKQGLFFCGEKLILYFFSVFLISENVLGVVKVQSQPIDKFGKLCKETQQFVLFNDMFIHVKKDVTFKSIFFNYFLIDFFSK